MVIVNGVDRFNERLFSLFIQLAIMRARSRESVHEAVARCDVRKAEQLVEKLVRKGASLSEADAKGRTPLHVALEQLQEAAEEESAAAEDLKATTEETRAGESPMMAPTSMAMAREGTTQAAQGPSSADWLVMVSRLLHHQTDLNALDDDGHAPIHIAVRAGLHEVTRSLIDAGADPTLLRKGRSTLQQATIQRDTQMTTMLLDAAKASCGRSKALVEYVDCIGPDGWSALGLAARAGDVTIVSALLDAGADRAAVMRTGKTALDIARLNKRSSVVTLLES